VLYFRYGEQNEKSGIEKLLERIAKAFTIIKQNIRRKLNNIKNGCQD